jgi:hypothetical protein
MLRQLGGRDDGSAGDDEISVLREEYGRFRK